MTPDYILHIKVRKKFDISMYVLVIYFQSKLQFPVSPVMGHRTFWMTAWGGRNKIHRRTHEFAPRAIITLAVRAYFASVVSVATSTAGLLLAKQREIHSRVAKRAWIAFFVSRAATTSSTT